MLRGSLDFDKLYERLSGNIKYQSDRLKIKNGLHKRDAWLAIPFTAVLYTIRRMFITIWLCFESYQFWPGL